LEIILAVADMTIYIRKLNKVTGEFDTYCDGKLLTPEELEAYEQEKEDKAKDITMICNNCGKHGYSLAKKNGEPRKKQCPECGEQMVQHFSILVKKDESQIRRKVQRFNHYGMDKQQAEAFYKTSIERSKRAIDGIGGASHYTPMHPDMDYMVKNGIAKPTNESEISKKQQKVTSEVAKVVEHKKVKVSRSNNNQTIK
jgi:hypothetical protein